MPPPHFSVNFTGKLAAAACLAALTSAAAAQDNNLGRNLAATCANCHGTNGKSVAGSGMESLAGSDKVKLVQKIMDFRSGAKPGTIMQQIAKGYSDEQIDLIANYYAEQK